MAGTNPFDSLATASTKNPFDSLASTSSGNPFDGLAGKAGKAVQTFGDVLDTPRRATQEAIFHKGSSDANRAALRKAIGISGAYDHASDPGNGPEWATHALRGLTDTALDTVTDPMSLITGLAGKAGKFAAPLLGAGAKALESAPLIGGKVAKVNELADTAGQLAREQFIPHGKAVNAVGQEPVDFAIGAKTKTSSHEVELEARLQKKFEAIRSGLSDDDFATALQIQKGERQAFTNEGRPLVSLAAAGAAASLKHLFKQAYALRADASGQRRIANYAVGDRPATSKTVLAQKPPAKTVDLSSLEGLAESFRRDTDNFIKSGTGQVLTDGGTAIRSKVPVKRRVVGRAASTPYQLDADLAEFGGQPGSLSWQQNKRNYVPGPREAKAVEPNKAAQQFNLLDKFDPNAEHQGDFAIDRENTAPVADAVRGMLKNTAGQVSRAELRKELEARFGKNVPPEISKLFDITTKATGTARSKQQVAGDAWKQLIDLPKRAVVGVLPRHMMNVASLAALNDPAATARAIAQAARMVKNPASRYDELREGIESGAIGPRAEHDVSTPEWLNKLLDKAGPIGKAARWYPELIDNATWSLDEAAVNQIAKAKGGGYSAGRAARRALVDYDNPSQFTQKVKPFAPFGTFEANIPGAVGKAIARNPAGVEAANRLTGGTLLGGETDIGGHKVKLNLPTAKVGRLLGSGDIPEYVRGATADPVRALASLATSGNPRVDPKHYMTYGLDPRKPEDAFKILTNMAAGGIPEARDILDQLGDGPYKPTKNFVESLLQNASGVSVK